MSELSPERKLVKQALDELEVDAWVFEHDAGARPESIEQTFLQELEAADLYLGIFWRRYGPYTGEEYEHAANLEMDRLVYEKRVDLEGRESELEGFLEDLRQVRTGVTVKWFESAEELRGSVKADVASWQTRSIRQRQRNVATVKTLTTKLFDSEKRGQLLEDQVRALTQAVRALAADQEQEAILDGLANGRTGRAKDHFREVAAEQESLESLKEAAKAQRHLGALAFLDDRDAALMAYKKATSLDPENPEGWNQLGHLLRETGDLLGAESAYRRALAAGEKAGDLSWQGAAANNVGTVLHLKGDLDQAVTLLEASLAIHQKAHRKVGEASNYANLGKVLCTRGDLEQALHMHKRALALHRGLGSEHGVACDYDDLGRAHRSRGDLDEAARMHEQSLALSRRLGDDAGMASAYDGLGSVAQVRGDLDRAVELYERALTLNRQLGRTRGMAANYGNLGVVHHARGDLDQAARMYEESLDLYQQMGIKEGMARGCANLAIVHRARGRLDEAAEMFESSLALVEALDNKEEMAIAYGRLGSIHHSRGDLDRAVEMLEKAIALNRELDRRQEMASDLGNLGLVHSARGDLPQAERALTRARDLFAASGMPQEATKAQQMLSDLGR